MLDKQIQDTEIQDTLLDTRVERIQVSLSGGERLDWREGKGRVADNPYEGLNLEPPEGGYELWRHKNADKMGTKGWSGLYWARPTSGGDYEIRTLLREGEAFSYPGGVFPKEAFERLYERVHLVDTKPGE